MTALVAQGSLVVGVAGTPPNKVGQGALVLAVSFLPPNSPPEVVQGSLVIAVRQIPVYKYTEINPAVDLPCIASCGSVPHFWRQT